MKIGLILSKLELNKIHQIPHNIILPEPKFIFF